MAKDETTDEEIEEWLGRLDIPIEKQTSKEVFREYLKDELGIIGDKQVDALWSGVEIQTDLAEHGIKGVTVPFPWGAERRYGIQGLPGLWGWESVKTIMEEEE